MGHERIGALPRSKRWRDVVREIGAYPRGDVQAAEIAKATIDNVQRRVDKIRHDDGFAAAFQYLVGLSVASRQQDPDDCQPWGVELPEVPTPMALGLSLRAWIRQHSDGGEHVELATQAATDTFAQWQNRYKNVQGRLFEAEPHPYALWKKAGRGDGFSELCHLFFANFTRRYLNYFLEREASSELSTLEDRNRFDAEIANHASETAKITQSFAAGWFNKHAAEALPSKRQIEGFLDFALGKIKEELLRERDAS